METDIGLAMAAGQIMSHMAQPFYLSSEKAALIKPVLDQRKLVQGNADVVAINKMLDEVPDDGSQSALPGLKRRGGKGGTTPPLWHTQTPPVLGWVGYGPLWCHGPLIASPYAAARGRRAVHRDGLACAGKWDTIGKKIPKKKS
jgi:hypothetical protein